MAFAACSVHGDPAQIPTSIGRLFLHIFPLLLLAFFLWVREVEEQASN